MKRTKIQREKDLTDLAVRYLRGEYQADIAVSMGVTQATISNDLKELQVRWLAASVENMDEMKSRELAKVDNLEREYWEAWARSKEDAEVNTMKQRGEKITMNGKTKTTIVPVEGTIRKEGQSGNPAFLKGVEWCIDKRCQLFGLDAPLKVEWMKEVQAIGLDPGAIFDELVGRYVAALEAGGESTP